MAKLTAHTIVKNEEQWVWYAIMSVIQFVDKLIIFDTGSTDNTPKILKYLKNTYPDKITLKLLDNFPEKDIGILRQQQIEMTETEWIMILDGDEIWDKKNISSILKLTSKHSKHSLFAVKFLNFVFNTKFCQTFSDSSYNIGNITGAITIKFMNLGQLNIKCGGDYGVEGFFNQDNVPIQNLTSEILVPDVSFFHMTHTIRSRSLLKDMQVKYRRKKILARPRMKYNGPLPEVFFIDRPDFIQSPFVRDNPLINYWLNFRIKK